MPTPARLDPRLNLGLAALAMVATLPGRTQGLGLITEPLLADLKLDRVDYASFNLCATLIGALFCIPCGRMLDRYGGRKVLAVILAALGITVVVMGRASGPASLFFTITLTRGFGQSALSVVSLALMGKWFSKRLNMAMGVYSLLVGVGFVISFPIVGHAVLTNGWRFSWTVVGLAVLALAPLAWLQLRQEAPAEAALEQAGALDCAPGDDLDFATAMATPAFWVFAFSSSLYGLVASGISLFNQSILEQRGFDASVFHTTLVIATMVGLACNFGGGWLATRYSLQRIMGGGMAMLMAALLALPHVRTFSHVVLYAIAMGAAGGVVTVVFFSVWGQVYGKTHLGRIQGAAQMMTVLASAVGPLLLAETLRRTGSYDSIFYALGIIVGALGAACIAVPLPQRGVRRMVVAGTADL